MEAFNKNKKAFILIFAVICIVSLSFAHFFIDTAKAAQEDVKELTSEIDEKKKEIEILQKEIDAFQDQVTAKAKEAKNLSNQVAIVQNQVAKIELDVESIEKKIEQTNLEIRSINLEIEKINLEIEDKKEKIAEFINIIYRNDQVSYLEVMMTQSSFSKIFDYFKNTQQLQAEVKTTLNKLKAANQELGLQKENLEEKKISEEDLKDDLVGKQDEFNERRLAQSILLSQTRLTQRQYQNYLHQLQLEQQQANSEIVSLEKTIREELEKRAEAERFRDLGPAQLSWPVDPSRGITTFFNDPEYPFRHLFEHSALDIRAYQGTTIKAPEDGYVARVQFDGSTRYSYVVLIHNDGLSTVASHISKPLVQEGQFVTQGQPIALSGGAPGSVGSGNLTTGPHLHFEVRLNGIPVDPLEYLPY